MTGSDQRLETLVVSRMMSQRPSEPPGRDEVVRTIREIVINLLGCEEFALFHRPRPDGPLQLLSSMGIDPGPLREIELERGLIGGAATSGQLWRAGLAAPAAPLPHEEELTACLPLLVDGRLVGALALFALLPHRPALGASDAALLSLLGREAAVTLSAIAATHGETSQR